MGSMYQPQREGENPLFNPPLYAGVSRTFMIGSNSILVFLRKDIGHRTLHPMTILPTLALHLSLGYVIYHAQYLPLYARQSGLAMMVYAGALAVLTGYHERNGLKLAFRARNPVHTMSRGRSLFAPVLPDGSEVLLVLVLSYYFINYVHWYVLGWWLLFAAVSYTWVEVIAANHNTNAVLDVRDSQAEARYLQAAQSRLVQAPQASGGRGKKAASGTTATLAPELQLHDDARPRRRGLFARK